MPKTDFFEERLNSFLEEMEKYIIVSEEKVSDFKYKYCDYKKDNTLPVIDESFKTLSDSEYWGGKAHIHAWFYKKITVPDSMVGHDIVLKVDSHDEGVNFRNPQFIAYVDGVLRQGLDVNHREIFLDNAKKEHEIYLYAYTATFDAPLKLDVALIEYDKKAEKLYHTLMVAYETAILLNPEDKVYADLRNAVTDALNLIDLRAGRTDSFIKSVDAALNALDTKLLGKKTENTTIICIGHTHIDVAWLWTLGQTREKVQRSFSTVVALMKKYPEYKFMSSQAQLYKYLKLECPELYEEVKKLVKEGRWEVEGSMWVEADCNLSSGESLVRQILYGKKFFKNEFGVDNKVLWLPDVFGYSAALPQILTKSGVDKFVTSKISWNETNKMPNDTFFWYGIDGTPVFTYFLTAQGKIRGVEPQNYSTYNAQIVPAQMAGTYERYQNKGFSDEVLLTFGFGDGGGGPTKQHQEYYDVMKKGIPGIPTPKQEFAGVFFDRLLKKAKKDKNIPHWYGELYLEFHRGTYTSMAKNKKYNRKCEFLFERAESFSRLAEILADKPYPADEINDAWEIILLNQFHDIIPGSSIKEVYEESHQQYEQVLESGNKLLADAENAITENICTDGGVIVFNPNSFDASGEVTLDGKCVYVKDIPSKGYKVINEEDILRENTIKVSEKALENRFFKLTLDKKGTFTKIYDKKNKRDVLKKGERGNVLTAYEDIPRRYDNWEISNYYKEKSWEIDDVVSIEPICDGVRAGLKIVKTFLSSTLCQKIWLYENSPRIDFENDFDWKEKHLVVKSHFPVDINSQKATYDIQFGSVERPTHMNTSWDSAKFEVCAHKYADLSEYGYGVSLMNDCKYGHDIHEGVMSLTLLKCGTHPNPDADKCRHEFTYSLYPHSGNLFEAGTINEAYKLNIPMSARKIEKKNGNLPDEYSMLKIDRKNVIAETIKKAEYDNSTVIRLYECFNQKTKVTLELGFDFEKAYICDLMEENETEIKASDRNITFEIKPFEIVTLKIR